MNYRKLGGLVLVLLLIPRPDLLRAEEPDVRSLTLNECVVRAIKNNLGVAVQVITARQAEAAVTQAGEKFLPLLSFDFYRDRQNSSSFSWIDSSDVSSTAADSLSGGVTQNMPLGGSLTLGLSAGSYESNARFQTINPYYSGQLSFNWTQPLLKDFGWDTSRKDIVIARNNNEIAVNDLKSALIQTVFAVERAYWELVYQIESLAVQHQSLKLAEDLLEKSRKEVEIGTLAPKEVLTSQAEVASRKADILLSEMLVKDSADTLRGLLNLGFEGELVPAETPAFAKPEANLEEALSAALTCRPDLQSSAIEINNREADYSYAKNQMLPSLSLSAKYWSPGLSGDRILYLDDNPLTGIILGKVPGGSAAAIRDALHLKYKNWSVALSLEIPLSTVLTRAAQAQARAGLDLQIARKKQAEQTAALEVRAAFRAVQTNYERVGAYRIASDLAAQKLAAEEAKLKVGLSDSFKVLQ
ncbi:MAG: TolC family protein, partial [Candidatus Aminicenantes bacterium]|nr:TolC family protein [Candidatus Aminicenantes bacterium]